jgi:hypothetical protein
MLQGLCCAHGRAGTGAGADGGVVRVCHAEVLSWVQRSSRAGMGQKSCA